MTRMSVEIEGSADEVIGVLLRLGYPERYATAGNADGTTEEPVEGVRETTAAAGTPDTAAADEADPAEWTEDLARDFLSRLQPVARRVALQVWRAGEVGMHRSVLCQRAELTPMELRSLLMRMGHALRRLQRERGMTLSRPMAANTPLQTYFVDAGFAAVTDSQMFGDGMPDRMVDGAQRP